MIRKYTLIVLCLAMTACGPKESNSSQNVAGETEIHPGQQVAMQCVSCHGIDGRARIPGYPHLAGQDAVYMANQLVAYRSGARKNPIMNAIASGLNDDQIKDVSRFYSQTPSMFQKPVQ